MKLISSYLLNRAKLYFIINKLIIYNLLKTKINYFKFNLIYNYLVNNLNYFIYINIYS